MDPLKEKICDALAAFIRQRPGFEYGNYGDMAGYRSDVRRASRQKRDAETLLVAVRWRDSISGADLLAAASGGRLSIEAQPDGCVRIDYCTGQYWPTEYRVGVCRVLAQVLWNWQRDNMPASDGRIKKMIGAGAFRQETEFDSYGGISAGDWLRRAFRREFGSSLQRRWFD